VDIGVIFSSGLDQSFVPYLKQGVAFSDIPEERFAGLLLDIARDDHVAAYRWLSRVFLVKN